MYYIQTNTIEEELQLSNILDDLEDNNTTTVAYLNNEEEC